MPDADISAPIPEKKYNSKTQYVLKACKWFFGNAVFGIFPLIILGTVAWLTHGRDGSSELNKMIYDGGIVLFVCISIMGSIVVDYMESGINSAGIEIFAVYIFPFLVMGFVSLEFLLVCFGKIDKWALSLSSKKTLILILFSIVYSIPTKATFYLKEDSLQ